ncbi:hypothetical protein ANN_19470, partial [Periplaneta americana]
HYNSRASVRARFNKVQVDRYFENLKECLGKYKFPPHRLFNMDETGVSTVPDKTAKVVATKEKKSIKKIKSAERDQIVTAVFLAVTQMEVSGLFRAAFERVTTAGNAVAAFRDTCMYPCNPHVFNDYEFLPSEVTKIDLPIAEDLDQSANSNRDEDINKQQEGEN